MRDTRDLAADRLELSSGRAAPPPALTPTLWGILCLLGFIWGGGFFLIHLILREMTPYTLVACRVGLAAVVLLVFLRLRGVSLDAIRARPGRFLLLGLLNNALPFTLIALGQTAVGAGLAAIINATTPLWTILVAAAFTRDERLSPARLAGLCAGIGGVAVLIGPEALGLGQHAPVWALVAIVLASLSYGFAAVFARSFKGTPPAVMATGQLLGSSAVMITLALVLSHGSIGPLPSITTIVCLAALALFSTAFAYILLFRLIAEAGATNASLVTFIVPASAILLGILFLDETLSLRVVGGFALILAGLAIVDGRLLRRFRPTPNERPR